MKNILVINLTRIGDLVQTTNMLSGLREKYPFAKITLLANKRFEGISPCIPFVDEIRLFDIIQFEDKLYDPTAIVSIYKYLDNLIEGLNGCKFDLVINLTHSKLSAIIALLLDVKEIIGIVASREGNRIINGPWLNYFFGMVVNREFNLFNLVDMYSRAAKVKPKAKRLFLDTPPKDKESIDKMFGSLHIVPKFHNSLTPQLPNSPTPMPIIGFQLGSSRVDRRWPTASFAKLALMLISNYGAKILLFGSKNEADMGTELESLAKNPNIINLIGKTTLGQLAAFLKHCNLLVTNDTGTMHIATAVGTKVITLFFAHALYTETGPYGDGHIVVQADIPCSPCSHHVKCKDPICLNYILPEDLFEIIVKILDNSIFNNANNIDIIKPKGNIKIFFPAFDTEGFIEYLPLLRYKLNKKDVIRLLYKEMWKLVLDYFYDIDCTGNNSHVLQDKINLYTEEKAKKVFEKITDHYEFDPHGLYTELNNIIEPLKEISRLADEGIALINTISLSYKDKSRLFEFKTAGANIDALDEKIEHLSLSHNMLSSIFIMFKFGKENQTGDDINILAQSTLRLYHLIKIEAYILILLSKKLAYLLLPQTQQILACEHK